MPDPSLVLLPSTRSRRAIPIVPLTSGSWPGHERALGRPGRTWLKTQGFAGQTPKDKGRKGRQRRPAFPVAPSPTSSRTAQPIRDRAHQPSAVIPGLRSRARDREPPYEAKRTATLLALF